MKNQYSSNGLSLSFPVVGSTSNPKDSKTTTPSKTLSITSEIQIGKASSLFFSFIHALPLSTFIIPAPVDTSSVDNSLISSSSASFLGKTVKLAPVSTKALTFFDFVFSKFDNSISTQEWPIQFTGNNDYNQLYLNLSDFDSNKNELLKIVYLDKSYTKLRDEKLFEYLSKGRKE